MCGRPRSKRISYIQKACSNKTHQRLSFISLPYERVYIYICRISLPTFHPAVAPLEDGLARKVLSMQAGHRSSHHCLQIAAVLKHVEMEQRACKKANHYEGRKGKTEFHRQKTSQVNGVTIVKPDVMLNL